MLLVAVARDVGPGFRVAHLVGVWMAREELAGAEL
jgi:hypothetical protein